MPRVITMLLMLFVAFSALAQTIYVSPNGNDSNTGTINKPLRHIQNAIDRGGNTIILRHGTYLLSHPLVINKAYRPSKPLEIRTLKGEQAIISGGEANPLDMITGSDTMQRIMNINVKAKTITIPTPSQIEGMNAMIVHQQWAIAILRIKEMIPMGDSTVVSFLEPEGSLEFEHPYPQPIINGPKGSSAFRLIQLHDMGCESSLVRIAGNKEHPAENIIFKGITFEHAGWKRPLEKGHVTLQGGMPLVKAFLMDKPGTPWSETLNNQAWIVRPEAAVSIEHSRNIAFLGCTFRNIANNALDIRQGTKGIKIEKNQFRNIGGTAIMAGYFQENPTETHIPYTAEDTLEYCSHISIIHNQISNATALDWGAAGIQCGYVNNANIIDNSIDSTGWSGIAVGWGWTPVKTMMHHNRINGNFVQNYGMHHHDCGGIYTLSYQPFSEIKDNIVYDPGKAPYATNDRVFPLYLDDSSNGFTITGNNFTQEQCGFNHPGNDIIWQTPRLSITPSKRTRQIKL